MQRTAKPKKQKMADLRNKKIEKWNETNARGKPKHLYFMVTGETHHLLACQRIGCPLNTSPGTWPIVNPRTLKSMPSRCVGAIEDSELENGKLPTNVLPSHLHTLQ